MYITMKLSKPMVKVMVCLAKNAETLPEIAKATGLSINRCSELGTELEDRGLAAKSRYRQGLKIRLANNSVAESFRKMYLAVPYMQYDSFLYGIKLEILKLILYEEKSVKELSKISGIKERTIRENLRGLTNPCLFWRKRGKYVFARQGYPLIYHFLDSLRNFTSENKRILWKYNEEELFRTRNPELVKGNLTGLSAYRDFGVTVNTVEYFCCYPCAKLTKKKVFVHSLLEIGREPRLLGIAIAFYLKHHLERESIGFLLAKYDLAEAFKEFKKTIDEFKNASNKTVNNEKIPPITLSEIERILDIYGVKNVRKK